MYKVILEAAKTIGSTIPSNIKVSAIVVCVFVTLDTISGVWLSGHSSGLSSKISREKLAAKCIQYAIICGCSACGAAIAGTWNILYLGHFGIISIEFMSLMENLVKLQKAGGANIAPIKPLINILSKLFEGVENEQK